MTSVYINTVLSVLLFWTCFCRLVRTDDSTHAPVRFAFWVLAGAAMASLAAPFAWGYSPGWPALLLLAAMTVVQALTALYWRDGVPAHFQKCECDWEVHP